jgi:hypothetical protein
MKENAKYIDKYIMLTILCIIKSFQTPRFEIGSAGDKPKIRAVAQVQRFLLTIPGAML